MLKRTAIIGAGIAGLSCARRLQTSGHEVAVFDKSRGVGGRMATRRVDGLSFDHGAQFFTSRGKALSAAVQSMIEAGSAAEWGAGRYVGTPGMTAVPRAIAQGLEVRPEHTLTRLERGADGWTLHTAEGQTAGGFDQIVLAVPAPQAIAILEASNLELPGIETAVYAPCWALMAAFSVPLDAMPRDMSPSEGPISWAARNGTKPGRASSPETVVVHASPAWSRAHLEDEADAVRNALLEAFRALGGPAAAPVYAAVHRWRYALVETAAGRPCFHDAALGIGACGDWCIGGRVEAAFDSGLALAETILAAKAAA